MRAQTLRRVTAAAAAFLTIAPALAQPGQQPGRQGRRAAPQQAAAPALPQEWVDQLQWRSVGPANMSGRITALAVYEADPTIYWAASASGGLLKTTNNGATFEHQFDREKTVSIGDVAVAQSDPSIVWVGTGESNPRNSVSWGNGVYKSTDGGKTWEHKGLDESFQIGSVVIHPQDPDIVYVGALGRLWGPNEERGLYKTTDGGDNWERILYIDDKTGVVDVNMHPEDHDTLLVATYERQRDEFDTNDPAKKWGPGSGIFKTTDGGETWTQVFAGLPTTDLGRIDIDYYRADPNVVYALVESSRIGEEPENAPYAGIQGEDAEVGARLTEIVADGPAAQAGLKVGDIVIKLGAEVVVSYDDLIAKIRSRVAGDTVGVEVVRNREVVKADWSFAYRPGSREDTEAAEAAGEAEAGEEGEEGEEEEAPAPFRTRLGGQIPNVQNQQGPDGHEFGGVYKSTDGGETWQRINSLNPRPMYFSRIRVDPSDDSHIFVLGISLHYSADGGETFNSSAHRGGNGSTHVDHHAMWINPEDGRHVILGNDGGVYVTHDRAAHWDHLNTFAIGQFYHVGVGPRRNYRIFGGLQDNGSWGGPNRSASGRGPINEDWFRVGGGDGFICLVDPEDPDEIYYESQNGGMGRWNLRTGDRGFLRVRAPRGMSYRFNWRTPFLLSNHNSQIWYSAGNYVFKSLRKGEDTQRISPEITNTDRGSATALSESPRDAAVLYVGTDDGALWMTRDGGHEWVDLFEVAPADDDATEDEGDDADADEAEAPPESDSPPTGAASGDPITGRWAIEMTGRPGGGGGGPAGGRPGGRGGFGLTLDLKRADDNSITGTFSSRMGEGELTEGAYDPETGAVKLVYTVREMPIELTGTLAEGAITGTMSFGERMSRDFTARRAAATQGRPGRSSGAEEPEAGPGKPISELVEQPLHVSGLEASRFEAGRIYLALDGHRSDDDAPYVFVSEDFGRNWRSLAESLPADAGSVRTVREDITSPDILYLGAEFGAWVSIDRGETWRSLNTNLPTVAVHEIAQHRSSGEIIAGTHGRSIWILDVTPLRQMNAALTARAHLFEPNTAIYWRSEPGRGGTLRRFEGQNDSTQAEIYYRLAENADVSLEVRDHTGKAIRELEAPGEAGLHRVRWDLRREPQRRGGGGGFRGGRFGPRIEPGNYLIVLTVDDQTFSQTLRVTGDPDHPDQTLWGAEYDRRLEAEREQMGGEEEDGPELEFSIIW